MIEHVIIGNLLVSPSFRKRIIKHLVPEHFSENSHIVDVIQRMSKNYPGELTSSQVAAELDKLVVQKVIQKDECVRLKTVAAELYKSELADEDWLFDSTEAFTRDKMLYLSILESISIYENKDKKSKKTVRDIPAMLSRAIDLSFSPNVGLDFWQADTRWDEYNKPETRIPFRLKTLNIMTGEGAVRGSLNIVNAPINKGKSMTLFSLAADYMSIGYNVAVFTMEMAELEVMKRIDANMLNTPINEIPKLQKGAFVDAIQKVQQDCRGRLKVREYYTGEGNVSLFKQQLEDWFAADGFKPDVIVVDYLGICTSAMPGMLGMGSYAHLKQISVELRALAQFSNTVLWTAMQLNREGIRSSGSGGMADMSESIGVPMTADFIIMLHRTPDMDVVGKVNIIQVKTRYADATIVPNALLKLNLATQRFDDDPAFLAELEMSAAITRSVKSRDKRDDVALDADTLQFMSQQFLNKKVEDDSDLKV